MNFQLALTSLQSGSKVSRSGWNGPGQMLRLHIPDGDDPMTLPYIYIETANGHLVPWLASQTDLLAEDWLIVD